METITSYGDQDIGPELIKRTFGVANQYISSGSRVNEYNREKFANFVPALILTEAGMLIFSILIKNKHPNISHFIQGVQAITLPLILWKMN